MDMDVAVQIRRATLKQFTAGGLTRDTQRDATTILSGPT
jgi:hypothetical protein